MRRSLKTFILLLPWAMALLTCAPDQPTKSAPIVGGQAMQRNQGYSLLYGLFVDNADVAKVFIIKGGDDSVKSVVKEIAQFCQDSKKRMDDFSKADPTLHYDVADLPALEKRSRDLQAKDDEHAILFSQKTDFELRLIYTQIEAMDYAVQLAKALIEHEDNGDRKVFLGDVIRQGSDYHHRLMALLTLKS